MIPHLLSYKIARNLLPIQIINEPEKNNLRLAKHFHSIINYSSIYASSLFFFFPKAIATAASTALIKHHPDQIARSE